MTKGCNCLQLHDKTLLWYKDTWTQSYSAASLHCHHWRFLWLWGHPQLRVWGRPQQPHLMKPRAVWSPSNCVPSGCLRKGNMEEWFFSYTLLQLLGWANQAVPGETSLWGIRPFGSEEGKIQWMSCLPGYFHITYFSTMVWADILQAVQWPQIHVTAELKCVLLIVFWVKNSICSLVWFI